MLQSCNSSNQSIVYPKQSPQLDKHYAAGVSGHVACILEDEDSKEKVLLMGGGANFPEVPAVDKGEKFFYKEVYAYKLSNNPAQWQELGALPEENAYSAFVDYNNALYVAGGENHDGASDLFYRLRLRANNLVREELPKLPLARSGAKLLVFNKRFYLLGGSEAEMTNSMYSWAEGETEWKREEAYPHSPYLKTLAAADKDYIYLWGTFPHEEYGNSEQFLTSPYLHKYDPRQAKWVSDYIDGDEIASLPCFGGGMAYYDEAKDGLILLGGVNAERFLPALRRGDLVAKAMAEGNDELVQQYRREGKAYMSAAPEWHAFNQKAYRYDKKDLLFECLTTDKVIARADAHK